MSSEQDLPHLVDSTGRQYPLIPNKEFTIGRSLNNSLTIEDLTISRMHCRLKETGKFWSVIDESVNGILVNDKQIHRKEVKVLSNGDTIKLSGKVWFKFAEAKSVIAEDIEMNNIVDRIETEHTAVACSIKTQPATKNTDVSVPIKQEVNNFAGEASGTSKNTGPAVESELQCSICTELFVMAQTLNCSHTFCKKCINEWKKKNKTCPICRARIKTVTPTIALDNVVNTILQNSSEEVKQSRKLLLEERERANPPRQKRRGNNREMEDEPVLISSDEDTDSDDMSIQSPFSDSDDWMDEDLYDYVDHDYIPGNPSAYYGGYGSCFNCGARGHWANGCPLK